MKQEKKLTPLIYGQKKLIVIPTTNLALTLKSNTMKNSMQNYKLFSKTLLYNIKILLDLTLLHIYIPFILLI